ncbi:chorismate synthase [Clostridium sp. DJ247]|uniref:chorismate synthase n=1 Tax=Clostridium sp. DJ247 TaxID=2726188 RepID=UPI001626A0B9|nr:chorismate synthase [Clostridium sp. DJ247]MBC2581936.1 chorismate synthase [Clostridium sp. DJ247]
MSGVWGQNIQYSIFGESHGDAIGIVISGLPSGIKLDLELIKKEMQRRAPGSSDLVTPRKEEDNFEILSGYFEEHTTGTPLCAIIRNKNIKSSDYTNLKYAMRPGHADYGGRIKYKGFNDYRGSGHFSGRITASLVFGGAIAKQILAAKGIKIISHVLSIHNVKDEAFDLTVISDDILEKLSALAFPVINEEASEAMKRCILDAKERKNSVGGIIECAVLNVPPGIGNPFFDSVESTLAHLLFSVPAVKAIEFGKGFPITEMEGSESNDPYTIEDGKIKTLTNNNGGIIGGITNGMPIVLRCAIKPTASIGLEQQTIDIVEIKNTKLKVEGRHDPCIVPRVLPVIEAVSAIGVLEQLITVIDKI